MLEKELAELEIEEKLSTLRRRVEATKANIQAINSNRPSETRPTLQSLSQDEHLNEAVNVLKSAHLTDLLDEDPHVRCKTQGMSAKLNVLFITDFITKTTNSCREEEREIAKGIFLKCKNKTKPEDVTVPQWISANARILLAMLDNLDKGTVASYLRYTAKIGDYLQLSEPPSVMLLDEDHRKMVARDNTAWDMIDGDKRYFFLEKSKSSYRLATQKKTRPVDETGKPICLGYNSQAGCTRPWCTYNHICSVNGCKENHSRFQHYANTPPPRFRGLPNQS